MIKKIIQKKGGKCETEPGDFNDNEISSNLCKLLKIFKRGQMKSKPEKEKTQKRNETDRVGLQRKPKKITYKKMRVLPGLFPEHNNTELVFNKQKQIQKLLRNNTDDILTLYKRNSRRLTPKASDKIIQGSLEKSFFPKRNSKLNDTLISSPDNKQNTFVLELSEKFYTELKTDNVRKKNRNQFINNEAYQKQEKKRKNQFCLINNNHQFKAFGESSRGHLSHENQDSFIYEQSVFIVCDGHGEFGKQVSSFVSTRLVRYLKIYEQKLRMNGKILQSIFKKVNEELFEEDINIELSGSTGVLVKIDNQNIYCANVGDSRAIMSRKKTLVELSCDHKPNQINQKQRILKNGGKVKQIKTSEGKNVGPYRVWNSQGIMPGLAVSRSFGDKIGSYCGVIAIPQVKIFVRNPSDEFIVIGSDGFYEFFRSHEVIDFVHRKLENRIQGNTICKMLLEEAKKRWIGYQQTDDITCVIIFL